MVRLLVARIAASRTNLHAMWWTNHVTFGAFYRFGAAPRVLSALSRWLPLGPKARRLRQTLRNNGAVHKRPVSTYMRSKLA